jgi:hypothetical protein
VKIFQYQGPLLPGIKRGGREEAEEERKAKKRGKRRREESEEERKAKKRGKRRREESEEERKAKKREMRKTAKKEAKITTMTTTPASLSRALGRERQLPEKEQDDFLASPFEVRRKPTDARLLAALDKVTTGINEMEL